MLDAVPELPQDDIRDVERILGHEIYADVLGADEPPSRKGLTIPGEKGYTSMWNE
jgi:hypothetical protein